MRFMNSNSVMRTRLRHPMHLHTYTPCPTTTPAIVLWRFVPRFLQLGIQATLVRRSINRGFCCGNHTLACSPSDGLGTSGMFLSGLIMVTRNRFVLFFLPTDFIGFTPNFRFIAWPALLFGINQLVNAHPLRSKEGSSGWTNLL